MKKTIETMLAAEGKTVPCYIDSLAFYDEESNRIEWKGISHNVDNIIEILKGIN